MEVNRVAHDTLFPGGHPFEAAEVLPKSASPTVSSSSLNTGVLNLFGSPWISSPPSWRMDDGNFEVNAWSSASSARSP
jgi:hypothetical protein